MSAPRQQKNSYHQKALQQIRNSLQPFATVESGSTSSGVSSVSSNNEYSKEYCRSSQPSPPSRQSPRGVEYKAQQYPFVPSQVPASVQQLLRRIDSPSSLSSSSSSNSPTSQLASIVNKPTLIIKSTVVQKPVLQTAVVPVQCNVVPPPLPPKPKPKLMQYDDSASNASSSPALTPTPSNRGDLPTPPQSVSPQIQSPGQLPPLTCLPQFSFKNGDYVPPYSQHMQQYHHQQQQQHAQQVRNSITPQSSNPPSPASYELPPSPATNMPQSVFFTTQQQHQPQHHGHNGTNNVSSSYVHLQPPPNNPGVPSSTGSSRTSNQDSAANNNKLQADTEAMYRGRDQQQHRERDKTITPEVTTHESPIPERKKLSKEKEDERCESKVRVYSPQAFKFFMEQRVENVIKDHKERVNRRMQLESEMAKIGLSEEAQTQMRKMLSQKESNYIRLKRAKMDKSMFKVIRTIGVGAFGEVALVKKLDSQLLYAMKTLRKSDVLRRNQVAHVKAERDILAEADNEWVVKLYYSFQDMDNLYFVMDYIPGGDLMSLLIKKGIFDEPLARFYIAELTCAIESVHKMGFIHRDIKPDNILIDRDGHIKLTDFGLCTGFRWTHNSKYYQDAKMCQCERNCQWQACGTERPLERRRNKDHIRCLAHSLVGTPNYIAPEVLMRIGYSQLCDWWSVGVILYEMLVGQPPFLAPSPAETQYKVINWASTLRIPGQAQLSSQAKDLILKLCTDHSYRLGINGSQEVKSHPFFFSIDFESGLRRTVAPYIPKIRHPTDTSNFDPCDGERHEDTDCSPPDANQFHGFFEFTFRRFFDDAYNEDVGPVYV